VRGVLVAVALQDLAKAITGAAEPTLDAVVASTMKGSTKGSAAASQRRTNCQVNGDERRDIGPLAEHRAGDGTVVSLAASSRLEAGVIGSSESTIEGSASGKATGASARNSGRGSCI
jgi:hypothetical protein